MSDTKACNLAENEIMHLIGLHGELLNDTTEDHETHIERINYLNKRLKTFKEPEVKPDAQFAADAKPELEAKGWPTNG